MAAALARVIALGAAVLTLAACGGAGGKAGTITLQVSGDPEETAVYRELVAEYEKRGSGKVRLVEVGDPGDHIQKLSTGFAADRPPEVFLVNYRNFAPFAARGGIDAAGPRLDRSKALRREDYYPEPLEAFTYRGVLQCMPQNVSSLVVYYNRDLFEQAGVPLPKRGWSYEDLRQAARRLTGPPVKTAVRQYGVGLDPGIVRLGAFVWSAGGDLVDDPANPTRFTIDTPEGRRGLQAFLDLQGGDRSAPFEEEVDAKGLDARFLDGELAMFFSSRREVPVFRTIKKFEWDVAPFPVIERPATMLHSDAYCVAKGDRADDAWRFVEFAESEAGQRIVARSGRIVPSLKRVAQSPDFLDPSKPPRSSQVFLDAIPTMRRLPVASTWPEIEDASDLAIKRAYYTELTVDEALERLRVETEPLLERARSSGGG